jgi:hypothetical protein
MNAYAVAPAAPAANRTGRDHAAPPARLGFPDMIDVDPGAGTVRRRTP